MPNVQKQTLLAPRNVKIDGNPIEWGNKYMARNHYIFYSMANDANNLYLVVHINDRNAIQKVLFGGITLIIELPKPKGSDQKENDPNVILKFPAGDDMYRQVDSCFSLFTASGLYNDILDTLITRKSKRDSIAMTLNSHLGNVFKVIGVSGIREIEEPIESIYNTDGLKVAARFNGHLEYTCELAIPLKFLGTAINSGAKFKYSIKENGKPTSTNVNGTEMPIPIGVTFGDEAPKVNSTELYIYSATSFSGSYTLVKK